MIAATHEEQFEKNWAERERIEAEGEALAEEQAEKRARFRVACEARDDYFWGRLIGHPR